MYGVFFSSDEEITTSRSRNFMRNTALFYA